MHTHITISVCFLTWFIQKKQSFIMHVNFALIFSTFCHLGIRKIVFLPFFLLKTGITLYYVVSLVWTLYWKKTWSKQSDPTIILNKVILYECTYFLHQTHKYTLFYSIHWKFPFISTEDFSSQENRLQVTVTVFQPI